MKEMIARVGDRLMQCGIESVCLTGEELVRCKNCKFAEKQVYHPREYEYKCILSEFEGLYDYHDRDWFCADGKKK